MDKPVVKAILICDNIITEAVTNKKSLIGIFEQINARNFPTTHPLLGIYVKLTNAQGKYKFVLELIDSEADKKIGFSEIPEIEVKDKLSVGELIFMLRGLTFGHAGSYEFRLLANGIVCENGTQRFEVKSAA